MPTEKIASGSLQELVIKILTLDDVRNDVMGVVVENDWELTGANLPSVLGAAPLGLSLIDKELEALSKVLSRPAVYKALKLGTMDVRDIQKGIVDAFEDVSIFRIYIKGPKKLG